MEHPKESTSEQESPERLAFPFTRGQLQGDSASELGESSRPEDLALLARVAQGIWADPAQASSHATEALSAALMLHASPARTIERAASALLRRARHQGMAANAEANFRIFEIAQNPFFRLGPEERFLLLMLHAGRWSYARLARIFEAPLEEIERAAWSARLQLSQIASKTHYPAGAAAQGAHCPEYFNDRPWTQKLLDDEIGTSRDRLFFQNHLMACDSCRGALERSRELYFSVEALLPTDGEPRVSLALEKIRDRIRLLNYPSERTFLQTMRIFVRRRDVQVALGMIVFSILWKFFWMN